MKGNQNIEGTGRGRQHGGGLLTFVMTGNATACERKVVAIPAGRLGNQIFQFAVCYDIATEHGLCASQLRAARARRPPHP